MVVWQLQHVKERLVDDFDELVSEIKKQTQKLSDMSDALVRIETERKNEKERKHYWDVVIRSVLVGLILALTGWLMHIAQVTQLSKGGG